MTHPIADALRSAEPADRLAACRAAPDDPSAVLLAGALGEALGDPVRAVARAAIDALVVLARRDRGAAEVLQRALRSDDTGRRFGAAAALARLAPPGPALLPALVGALAHREGDVRWTAARLLVDAGRLHGEVLPLLLGLARGDQRPRVRRMAAFALRELAPDHPETARALVDASHDEDVDVRRAALAGMSALAGSPPLVVSRLAAVLDADDDPASRRIATVALAELGAAAPGSLPPAATERLRELARAAPDPDLRRGAVRALARLGLAPAAEAGGQASDPGRAPR